MAMLASNVEVDSSSQSAPVRLQAAGISSRAAAKTEDKLHYNVRKIKEKSSLMVVVGMDQLRSKDVRCAGGKVGCNRSQNRKI